jgi:hypothetical protein
MGFRFRKGFGLAKGLRVNLSKSGLSLSLGKKGMTYNIGRKGVRGTIGVPGSGMSYSDYQSYNEMKDSTKPTKMHIVMWVVLIMVIGFLIKTYLL